MLWEASGINRTDASQAGSPGRMRKHSGCSFTDERGTGTELRYVLPARFDIAYLPKGHRPIGLAE